MGKQRDPTSAIAHKFDVFGAIGTFFFPRVAGGSREALKGERGGGKETNMKRGITRGNEGGADLAGRLAMSNVRVDCRGAVR